VFGDLEDPESEVRRLLAEHFTIRRKPNLGTHPEVYYIV
jgi:molybdopterin-containing oxidoreductase family iron-sulfur binding subunit